MIDDARDEDGGLEGAENLLGLTKRRLEGEREMAENSK